MKTSATHKTYKTKESEHSPTKPRNGVLISPRAEAFKIGKKMGKEEAPQSPFDLRRYREIYSETD